MMMNRGFWLLIQMTGAFTEFEPAAGVSCLFTSQSFRTDLILTWARRCSRREGKLPVGSKALSFLINSQMQVTCPNFSHNTLQILLEGTQPGFSMG